ncbi:MAG: metallophosphoesterase [Bacteroidaceae bacterium]|nr:metallophosphoesterase [Bacteroidaceae bacterium]
MILAAAMLLISSCASLSPNGVGRVKRYTFTDESVPEGLDGCKIAFISDLHYPSLFTPKRLGKLVRKLQQESPDMLLLGGDYVTDKDSIDVLFKSLSAVGCREKYVVLGNHDMRDEQLIRQAVDKYGFYLLDGKARCVEFLDGGGGYAVAGVYDSFANDTLFEEYMESVDDFEFVLFVSHNPDFVERHSITAHLAFAGHTHGGQVSLFGIYTPVKNTRYGKRFLRGRNRTSNGTTIITTNGVGTSRRKLRFCVPSELVIVTLRRQ